MSSAKSIHEVSQALQSFGIFDYGAFVALLFVSILVGIYFGFFKVAENSQDYLMGGRNMKPFPVSLSLIASFISGIFLLGTPTEIYVYGVTYIFILLAVLFVGFVLCSVYVPVFHELQLTSTYEYLERRFDRKMRLFGAVLFAITMITWLPIVIYVPALAFNQVTGINVHIITPVVCIVCIFYTCVGGLKAVVWTDVIQSFFMFGSLILVMVKGTLDIGGFSTVWNRNMESGRIELPDFDWNLLTRHNMWALLFGGMIYWIQVTAINQIMLQRYLALPDMKSVRRAIWGFIFGYTLLLASTCYCGMLIYATYHSCDPLSTKLARAKDQLLPLLVMDILGDFPGLPGLFIAGVFSAALSSLSTGLNSMAAVVLEDFYKPFFPKLSEFQTDVLVKTVVIVLGILFVGLAFLVEKLGTVLQLSISLSSITNGPSLGIFTMGLLLPWIKSSSAFIGGISGLSFMVWLCLSAQAAILSGDIRFPEKPVSTDGCHYSFVEDQPPILSLISEDFNMTESQPEEMFVLYKISYLWYTFAGTFFTIFVGILASCCFGWNDPRDVDSRLLSPIIRKYIKPRKFDRNAENPDDIINAYTQRDYMRNQVELELSMK